MQLSLHSMFRLFLLIGHAVQSEAVDISDTEATSNEGTSSGALESKDN